MADLNTEFRTFHDRITLDADLSDEYMLAEKGKKGWHRSDPLALTAWFKEKVAANSTADWSGTSRRGLTFNPVGGAKCPAG